MLVDTAAGLYEVNKDQTIAMPDRGSKPVYLSKVQPLFDDSRLPSPDKIDVDLNKLFGDGSRKSASGVHVFVRDGKIAFTDGDKTLEVERGEAVRSDGKGGRPLADAAARVPGTRFVAAGEVLRPEELQGLLGLWC